MELEVFQLVYRLGSVSTEQKLFIRATHEYCRHTAAFETEPHRYNIQIHFSPFFLQRCWGTFRSENISPSDGDGELGFILFLV